MMTYLRTNISRRRTFRLPFALFVVFGAIAAAVIYLFPHLTSGLFTAVVRPYWRGQFSISTGALDSPELLQAKNEELRRQLDEANARLQLVTYIESENRELKALMGYSTSTSGTLAAVLKRPPYSAYDEIIIDAGADKGVSTTTTVFASGNIPIGKISQILGQTSKVIMFSSPGQRHEVLIGEDHIPAVAVGRGGGQYEAELPRGVNVQEGQFVISPALGATPLGKIVSVISDPTQPFQTVLFSPPVNISSLRWVYLDMKKR